MRFAERWLAGEPLRGVVGRLPAAELVALAATSGLDFVAVDLAGGPSAETDLVRLTTAAHVAELGVVAIAESAQGRLAVLGVDVVVVPDDPALLVVGSTDAIGDRRRPVALDLGSVVSAALDAFASAVIAPPSPLVLLPGMLGSARVFADVVAQLGDDVHCCPLRTDLDDSLSEVAASVLAAAPPQFALAGHSLGGIVALEVWRQAPQRITALALLNSSARPPSPAQLESWAELRLRTERGEFTTVVAELAAANAGDQPDGSVAQRCIEIAGDVGAEGFLRQLGIQSSRSDARACLRTIDVPALVLTGSVDTVCPPEIQAELAEAISDAVHVTVDGAGHMAVLDHPGDVAGALRRWLDAA